MKHINSDEVISRLNKIGGHVRGVSKMVEEGKPCDETLLQISAIQAALGKVGQIILEDHIEECVVNRIDDDEIKNHIRQFTNALTRMIR